MTISLAFSLSWTPEKPHNGTLLAHFDHSFSGNNFHKCAMTAPSI